jgi:glycosyltransferase involved in cell wall biosynthesis
MAQVSVIVTFLNAEAFIREAVESVLAQTVSDFELILVDDGSSDGSTGIARKYAAQDPRVRYLEHPGHANLGISASRNLGARAGNAPFIAFIDADDVWRPEKLAEQLAIFEAHPEAALVCGALLYWHSWREGDAAPDHVVLTGDVSDRLLEPPEAALRLYPLGSAPGAGVDLLVRRSAYEAVGGFESSFRTLYEDQAFLLKIFLRYPIFISGRPWLMYRQHAASCVATSSREYLRLRRNFLTWLDRHIREGNFDPAVRRVVQGALRKTRHDRVKAMIKFPLREARRLWRAKSARAS